MDIRRCTVAQIEAAPNLGQLLAQYADECAMPELGPAVPQFESYRAMEAAGFMHPIAAFDGDNIVGLVLPVVVRLPHYGVIAATVESIYATPEARSSGVGKWLRHLARDLAHELGAKSVLWTAPVGSEFADVLVAEAKRGRTRMSNFTFVEALQ